MNSSCRPYLVRGMYDWIVDNEMTPYVVVNVMVPEVAVPLEYVDNQNRIILNISPMAVREFSIDFEQDAILFQARFSGIVYDIVLPMPAIIAIYAHETGRGLMFGEDKSEDHGPNAVAPAAGKPKASKKLKPFAGKKDKAARTKTTATGPVLTVIEGGQAGEDDGA